MRICYSNIAWEPTDEEAAAALLRSTSIDAVDVAPGRYFTQPEKTTQSEAERVRDWWRERGIEVLGMQALLFGVQGMNLFGGANPSSALLDRLAGVCRVAGWMGARRLVFGSPRNRDRDTLSESEAADIAVPWFKTLGQRAVNEGVFFCLEPNPPAYNCNFMTTTDETARIVRMVDHAGIRLHLDAGAMEMLGEDPEGLVASHADIIGYAHVSEPNLQPVRCVSPVHKQLARALHAAIPGIPVSIEMRAAGLDQLTVAIDRTRDIYGDGAFRAMES